MTECARRRRVPAAAIALPVLACALFAAAEPPDAGVAASCARTDTATLTREPFATPDDVLEGLLCLERHFVARGDRRAIFTSIYVVTTRHIRAAIERGRFVDSEWASEYLVAFGNLYRQAVEHEATGARSAVPSPWRVAFRTARRGTGSILQDALLGINAHVTRDLAHALRRAGLGRDPEIHHADHTRINAILEAADDDVMARLGRTYSPALADLATRFGSLDDEVLGLGWEISRERAWQDALRLRAAPTTETRRLVAARIDAAAARRARRVPRLNRAHPEILERLRRLEGSEPGSTFCAAYPCR